MLERPARNNTYQLARVILVFAGGMMTLAVFNVLAKGVTPQFYVSLPILLTPFLFLAGVWITHERISRALCSSPEPSTATGLELRDSLCNLVLYGAIGIFMALVAGIFLGRSGAH